MHKFFFLSTVFLLILFVPVQSKCQSAEDHIYGKKWYAIKVFHDPVDHLKSTDFACEQTCSSSDDKPYLFYLEIDKLYHHVKTDKEFLMLRDPLSCRVSSGKLLMFFKNEDKIEFEILYHSDDFLKLRSPDRDTYFFISDKKLE